MSQNRYQRQLQLTQFGEAGQQKLARAKVLVIGAGGLGVPVIQYLAAMGVGTLGIVDADVVSLSNLHRQVIYCDSDVGQLKVKVCTEWVKKQNPDITVKMYPVYLSPENSLSIIKNYDVVVDATDNFDARYLINDSCVILDKPFVYGALQQFEGHVSVFNFQGGPTYRCLYPTPPGPGQIPDCNTAGVLGIVPGLIGSYQALETIKIITGIGKTLSGTLQVFDFLDNSQYSIRLPVRQENKEIRHLRTVTNTEPCIAEQSISPIELLAWIQGKKAFNLLDVREKTEYESGHLETAYSLPLSQLNGALPDLHRDIPWVLVCQKGERSKKAISYINENQPGLILINLEGGLSSWVSMLGNQFVVIP